MDWLPDGEPMQTGTRGCSGRVAMTLGNDFASKFKNETVPSARDTSELKIELKRNKEAD